MTVTSTQKCFVFQSCLFLLPLLSTFAFGETAKVENSFPISSTSIKFEASTNALGMKIRGQTESCKGQVEADASRLPKKAHLEINPESLKTGMDMRDRHMREKIFTSPEVTTATGKTEKSLPPIVIDLSEISCDQKVAPVVCSAKGTLNLRNKTNPVALTGNLELSNGKSKASGKTVIKLSDYAIEAPSQLGVKVKDEVEISFEVSY